MLEIKQTKVDNDLTLALVGRLDTNTAPQLEALKADFDGIANLTLDLTDLEYLSSAGLRVILQFQKMKTFKLVVKNVKEDIMEVFEMTGFAAILNIE